MARSKPQPHWSFWLIAVILLIWNGMGVLNFFMQLSPEGLQSFSKAHLAAIENRPVWATACFVTAVFGGTLASLALLMRKPASVWLFAVSMVATAVMMVQDFVATKKFGIDANVGPAADDIAALPRIPTFVWYARFAKLKGWLA